MRITTIRPNAPERIAGARRLPLTRAPRGGAVSNAGHRRISLPTSLGARASLPARQSAGKTPARMPALPGAACRFRASMRDHWLGRNLTRRPGTRLPRRRRQALSLPRAEGLGEGTLRFTGSLDFQSSDAHWDHEPEAKRAGARTFLSARSGESGRLADKNVRAPGRRFMDSLRGLAAMHSGHEPEKDRNAGFIRQKPALSKLRLPDESGVPGRRFMGSFGAHWDRDSALLLTRHPGPLSPRRGVGRGGGHAGHTGVGRPAFRLLFGDRWRWGSAATPGQSSFGLFVSIRG